MEKVHGIGPTLARKVLAIRNLDEAKRLWETMGKEDIQLLTLQDALYAVDALENKALTIEELQKKTGIGQLVLLDVLTEMELKGIIKAVPGGRFA